MRRLIQNLPRNIFSSTGIFEQSNVGFSIAFQWLRNRNVREYSNRIDTEQQIKSSCPPNTKEVSFNGLLHREDESNLQNNKSFHTPVMVSEVLEYLQLSPGQTIVDMTFGAGGHSTQILDSVPDTKIFALDRDPVAHECAQKLSESYPGRVTPLLGRFSELPSLLQQHDVKKNSVDAFLFDFGCSSMQFDTAERGFALAKDGPLDMRMDGQRYPHEPTAADVLERIEEIDLIHILKVYGEEKKAKKIARAIIEARYKFRSLRTTQELAQLVASVIGNSRTDKIGRFAHAATKVFQALRIFVNNELNEINYGIQVAEAFLKFNGRMVTISFHSLEDTIVKRHVTGSVIENTMDALPLKYLGRNKSYSQTEMEGFKCLPWKLLHKNVITPAWEEVERNPRARSAKLRASIRVKHDQNKY